LLGIGKEHRHARMLNRQNKGAALLLKRPKICICAGFVFFLSGCHHVLLVLAGKVDSNSA
jgi:hypothetical protein